MHPRRPWSSLALCALLAACGNQSVVGGPRDAGGDVAHDDIAADITAVTDTGADVGPLRCVTDTDCVGHASGPVCDTATGQCAPCTPARDLCPAGQYCTPANACAAGCRDDASCSGDAGVADGGASGARCDTATRRCVQCVTHDHCPAGNVCAGNVCVLGCSPGSACPGGQACCAGACVDTATNVSACGGCGIACAVANAAPACVSGVCAVGACTAPFADCDGAAANGCEADTASSLAHCGGCGVACAARANATARCAAGACAYACDPGFGDCDGDASNGCETDTRASNAHCGGCGARCALANATAACAMGTCGVAACAAGFADCDGVSANGCEVNTSTSASHCGACGSACPSRANATSICVAGVCGLTCATGFSDCDGMSANGCEVDTTRSLSHCGACRRACSAPNGTSACVMSRCEVGACNAGFADCNANATDGCETPTAENNNACGACGVRCAAGQACAAGRCESDCRRSGAVPCATGTVCDFTDGVCRAPGSRCLLAGDFADCGGQRCGPGSVCNPRTMTCVPSLSCGTVSCEAGTNRCWGVGCPCDRPTASCATLAPTAVPSSFLSGAFGFDIDDACNMYTATMLSGPDYVRRVSPAGQVTTWTSVANLNMGEVAVQRRTTAGSGMQAANVAFTYICCAACGCASNPPQGVGHVQSNGTLPVVVPATVSTGAGPFGVGYLDTGPYGLSVSALGEFFVGNVRANGDFFRYDTDTRSITAVTTLPRRVTASTSFDLDTMLVAVEGGALYLVDRAPGGSVSLLGNLGADVQSVRRDAFTGRFYASLRGGRVVSFLPDATGITTETMAARGSRVAISPDGFLYVLLAEGGPVSRIALPSTR